MEVLLLFVLLVLVWIGLDCLSDEINVVKDVLLGEIRKIKNRDDDDMK